MRIFILKSYKQKPLECFLLNNLFKKNVKKNTIHSTVFRLLNLKHQLLVSKTLHLLYAAALISDISLFLYIWEPRLAGVRCDLAHVINAFSGVFVFCKKNSKFKFKIIYKISHSMHTLTTYI